mgnify:CR=1 FL=1
MGFWQKIEYEDYPSYCGFCSLIGHTESVCHRKHPELRPVRRSGPSATPHVRQVFQPKGVPAVDESLPVVDSGLVVAMGVTEPENGISAMDVAIPDIPPPSANSIRGNSPPASVPFPIPVLSNASRGAEADAQNFLTLVPQESSSPAKALSDNILSSDGDDRLLALSSRVGRERKREISSSLSPTRHHGHVRLVRANSEGRSGVKGLSLVELKSFQDRLPGRIQASKLCCDPVATGVSLDDADSHLLQQLIQGHKGRSRQSRKREGMTSSAHYNLRSNNVKSD